MLFTRLGRGHPEANAAVAPPLPQQVLGGGGAGGVRGRLGAGARLGAGVSGRTSPVATGPGAPSSTRGGGGMPRGPNAPEKHVISKPHL